MRLRVQQKYLAVVLGAAALAATGTLVAAAASKPGPGPNPDAGLTNAQRDATYQQTEAAFQQRYAQWLRSPVARNQNLQSLPRHPVAASYAPGQSTITAARLKADAIVAGTVTGIRFDPGETVLTVHVDRAAKGGQPGEDVLVVQGGGLFPEPDFQHASLAIDESAPLLLPGERAVLLLQNTNRSDRAMSVQGFSGEYHSRNGRVTSTAGNHFGASIDGRTEDQLMTDLSD